jgi:guanylate kinase
MEILRQRIEGRGTDSRKEIQKRLENAREEIEAKKHYRHIVVNDRLEAAVSELMGIIEKAGVD